MSNAIGTV